MGEDKKTYRFAKRDLPVEEYPVASMAFNRLCDIIKDAHEANAGCVPFVFCPSFAASTRLKKQLSDEGLAFGVAVDSFKSQIRTLWELLGDGRQIPTASLRLLHMAKALAA
ncbi:MAG: hypothetical protein J6Y65_01160, partial [Eggerthellaceae bacterium]|nr:hypothetical protein [Eggerthellaceae bacterium]